MFKQLLVFVLAITSFVSCKKDNNSCDFAYFGGEIINPNNNYLLFYDDTDATIDTIYLDKSNRFLYKVEKLNPGLHSFVHGSEYQVVVLEPSDSVMIRLNTYDFDESLVFTGKGAKKNNYLINLFVGLESEEKTMYSLSKRSPEVFSRKVDSFRQKRFENLIGFKEKLEYSPLFEKVAKASINYFYDSHKELYPFRHYGRKNVINYKSLPDNFYSYRDSINYNDEQFKDYFPFYNFLIPHFDNLALKGYFETTEDSILNRNSINYNLNKLELMDSLVTSEVIKNNLFKYATRNYLSKANTLDDCEIMYESFIKKSSNKEYNEQISSLLETLRKLQPGNIIPEVEILNYRNEVENLTSKIEKPTVFFFWTKAIQNHFINSHKKVERLKNEHPNIEFVSININSGSYPIWKRLILQNNFPLENEYRFRNPDFAKKVLAIHYINKVMVVDENKRIVSSNASLFSKDFKELLNQIE